MMGIKRCRTRGVPAIAAQANQKDGRATITVVEYTALVTVLLIFNGAVAGVFATHIGNSADNVAEVEISQTSATVAAAIEDVEKSAERQSIADPRSGATESPVAATSVRTDTQAAGEGYVIRIDGDQGIVRVESGVGDERIESTTSFNTDADVETVGAISGGTTIEIKYEASEDEVQITT